VLTVALLMRLAWQVCRDEAAALLAGILAALSPFLLVYGASAFSDMSLLFCLALTLVALEARRYGGAGLALGCAFWCKPQALLLLPILVLLHICRRSGRSDRFRAVLALGGALVLLLIWDFARPETSVFVLGALHNTPETWLTAPSAWLPRLLQWLCLGGWLVAAPGMTLLLLVLAAWGRMRGARMPHRSRRADHTLLIYLGYTLGYGLLHTLFAFNIYDRYLLPLLPLLIIPLAAHVSALLRQLRYGWRIWILLCSALLATSLASLDVGLPLGGDYGRHQGIDSLARHLNQKPVATVIYDPWLGWELGYYLGAWHNKRRVHYPDAAALAAGAMSLDEIGNRYLVALIDRPHQGWLDALRAAGFDVEVDYERHRFVVYRLTPAQARDAP
jgi:4-amino-4-deoxy-L-arabinose transferase-like glycosyltransferase